MALKAFVSDINGVPEALRQCYKQQEYGRYKIDADDVEDVTGLKSALDRERAVLGMSSPSFGYLASNSPILRSINRPT